MKKRFTPLGGFTLVETIVVVVIIAIMSVFGVENIVRFQKDATLDQAVEEIEVTLKNARNKSMTGEFIEGMDIDQFDEGGLPEFGVNITSTKVSTLMRYKLVSQDYTVDEVENFDIDPRIIATNGETFFSRRVGSASGTTSYTFTLSGSGSRQIDIDNQGLIEISSL